MHRQIVILLGGVVCASVTCLAASDTDNNLLILREAIVAEKSAKTELKVENSEENSQRLEISTYQKRLPDGFLLQRVDVIAMPNTGTGASSNNKQYSLIIHNEAGYWQILPANKAIRLAFKEHSDEELYEIDPDIETIPIDQAVIGESQNLVINNESLLALSFHVQDSYYNEKLKARQIIRTRTIAELDSRTPAPHAIRGLKPAADFVPYTYTFLLNPKTKKILSIKCYTRSNRLISQHNYTEIERNIAIEDTEFEIPANAHIFVANSIANFVRYTTLP